MDTSTVVMMAAAILALAAVYFKSPQAAEKGLAATGSLILEITPRMIAAFMLAGLFQAVVPQEVIVRWMGSWLGHEGHMIGRPWVALRRGRLTHFPSSRRYSKWASLSAARCLLTEWRSGYRGDHVEILFSASSGGDSVTSVFSSAYAGWLCELIWDRLHVNERMNRREFLRVLGGAGSPCRPRRSTACVSPVAGPTRHRAFPRLRRERGLRERRARLVKGGCGSRVRCATARPEP